MKWLRILMLIFIFLSGGPAFAQGFPPLNTIRGETVIEAEGIPWAWYSRFFEPTDWTDITQDCLSLGAANSGGGTTLYSGGLAYRWPASGFDCYFKFYGNYIDVRANSTVANQDLWIELDGTSYLIVNTISDVVWSSALDLEEHDAHLYSTKTSGNTPYIDFILLEIDPTLLTGSTPYPTPTEITFPPTPTEITFPPTPTEITFPPTPTEITAMLPTPDGVTLYWTVQPGETPQTVAFRYEADGGQVMMVILLGAILLVLIAMLIAQLRRRAPEP